MLFDPGCFLLLSFIIFFFAVFFLFCWSPIKFIPLARSPTKIDNIIRLIRMSTMKKMFRLSFPFYVAGVKILRIQPAIATLVDKRGSRTTTTIIEDE